MRNRSAYRQAFIAIGISALIAPCILYAQSQDQMTTFGRSQRIGKPTVSSLERDLAGDEFVTQADRDLVERVWIRLENDPNLRDAARGLRITADAGEVTLWGTVENQDEKLDIGDKVQDIRGVWEVHNRLRVRTSDSASVTGTETSSSRGRYSNLGAEYAPPVEKRNQWWPVDRRVGAEAYRVGDEKLLVRGEMAATDCTGTTGPSGIRSFSTSSSAINPLDRVVKPIGDFAFTTVDRNLATRIRQALDTDPLLPVSNENVHLKVVGGTVTIEGWVPSVQAKKEIGAKIAEVPGVRGINNQLQIARSRLLATQPD